MFREVIVVLSITFAIATANFCPNNEYWHDGSTGPGPICGRDDCAFDSTVARCVPNYDSKCYCMFGYKRDSFGLCVPEAKCPPRFPGKNLTYPTNFFLSKAKFLLQKNVPKTNIGTMVKWMAKVQSVDAMIVHLTVL